MKESSLTGIIKIYLLFFFFSFRIKERKTLMAERAYREKDFESYLRVRRDAFSMGKKEIIDHGQILSPFGNRDVGESLQGMIPF